MCCHVAQTFVQPAQHLGKLLTSHEISSPWCIEPPGDGLQIVVVFEIIVKLVCEPFEALLLIQQPLTLLLKYRSLRLNFFERPCQRG